MAEETQQLFELMRVKDPETRPFLEEAYGIGKDLYEGKLYYGAPLLAHAFGTARIVAGMDLGGRKTISAALLHAVPLEGNQAEIANKLGENIFFLLQNISATRKIVERMDEKTPPEETLRLFISVAGDLRVLIVALAERLHTLRIVDSIPPEERGDIAREILLIYAPLAKRLGIEAICRELEDRAFQIENPDAFQAIKTELGLQHEKEEVRIKEFKEKLSTLLDENKITPFTISGRSKSIYSIWKKKNKKGAAHAIYDIRAVRICVPSPKLCYTTLGLLHDRFMPLPGRTKDYIAKPKPNRYQSLHTVLMVDENVVEIQIRTHKMHEDAEWGVAAHEEYKQKNGGLLAYWFRKLFPAPTHHSEDPALQEKIKKIPKWIQELMDPEMYVSMSRIPDKNGKMSKKNN